jgi:sporulation protein YlmC with PRC-barrel domain
MTRNAVSGTIGDPSRLGGLAVVGGDGEQVGHVDAVYYDIATDRAEWVAVRGGPFGRRVTLVPLRSANRTGDQLHIPFDKVQLRYAPHHDPGRALSAADEADLYRYYGADHAGPSAGTAGPSAATGGPPVGRLTRHAVDPGLRARRSI